MSYLTLKCTKFNFGWGSAQTPLLELTALPQTSWIQETLLSRGMDRMKEKEGKGKEKSSGVDKGRDLGPILQTRHKHTFKR